MPAKKVNVFFIKLFGVHPALSAALFSRYRELRGSYRQRR